MPLAAGDLGEAGAIVADGQHGARLRPGAAQLDVDEAGAVGECMLVAVGYRLRDDHPYGGDGIEIDRQRHRPAAQQDILREAVLQGREVLADGTDVFAEVDGAAQAGAQQLFIDLRQGHDAANHRLDGDLLLRPGHGPEMAVQHAADELQVVPDAVLQLLGQHVLLDHERLGAGEGHPQGLHPLARGHRLGQDIGEAGEEGHVVLVVVVLHRTIDLEHAIGLAAQALDDDVDGRDDAVLRIEGRQHDVTAFALVPQIVQDHRLFGDEGPALRRRMIGGRYHMADDAVPPAVACLDQQVVLRRTIAADLAEGDVEALGTGPGRLVQDLQQHRFPEGVAAEPGQGSLLPQQPHGFPVVVLMGQHAPSD